MIDTKQLLEYAQNPELAIQNLHELFHLLETEDETSQNYATEALENCGPPNRENLADLQQRLQSNTSSEVYWASTLLGRARALLVEMGSVASVQNELFRVVAKKSFELSARERAAWAISELGEASGDIQSKISDLLCDASPRLRRLLEAIRANTHES